MSFTIDIDTEIEDELYGEEKIVNATLKLDANGIIFKFIPESNDFAYMDISADENALDTCNSNGSFILAWSKLKICLICSRYGNGGGGTLAVEVPATPEAMDSLRACLRKWKAALKQ